MLLPIRRGSQLLLAVAVAAALGTEALGMEAVGTEAVGRISGSTYFFDIGKMWLTLI